MSLSEKASERKVQTWAANETALLTVIAVCFLVLHILAATTLMQASQGDAATASQSSELSFGD